MDNNFQKYKKFYFKKNVQLITKKLKYLSDDQIVFLVGFPRSGTTLLDSILRFHSNKSNRRKTIFVRFTS